MERLLAWLRGEDGRLRHFAGRQFLVFGRKLWPQSQTARLTWSSRLHFGHRLTHCWREGGLASGALLRTLRTALSAFKTAHCGWMPPREYAVVRQTGHTARTGPMTLGLEIFISAQRSPLVIRQASQKSAPVAEFGARVQKGGRRECLDTYILSHAMSTATTGAYGLFSAL